MRNFIYGLFALIAAIGLIFSPQLANTNPAFATVPAQLHSCLPLSPVKNLQYQYKMMGTVDNADPAVTGDRPMKSFSLVETINPLGVDSYTSVIGVDTSNKCFNYVQHPVKNLTLTAFMSQAQAIELSKQKYQTLAREPGGQQRIALLLKATEYGMPLAAEDLVALKDLAYIVPESTKVLVASNIYKFGDSGD
jgi:hypothetical protein